VAEVAFVPPRRAVFGRTSFAAERIPMVFLTVVLGFLFIVLCLFLILIVLLQPGKSGGLGGLGGGSASSAISETLGATQAEKSLSRWTMWGMTAFFAMCLLLTFLVNFHQSGTSLNLPPTVTSTPAAIPVGGAAPTEDGAAAAVETVPAEAPAETAPAAQ